jgi:type I restriction enzyme R subunit
MTLKAEQALEILLEKVDVLRGLFHGFDYSEFKTKAQTRNKVGLHSAAR